MYPTSQYTRHRQRGGSLPGSYQESVSAIHPLGMLYVRVPYRNLPIFEGSRNAKLVIAIAVTTVFTIATGELEK